MFLLILISKFVPTSLRLAHPPAGDQNLNPLESMPPDDDIKHFFFTFLFNEFRKDLERIFINISLFFPKIKYLNKFEYTSTNDL